MASFACGGEGKAGEGGVLGCPQSVEFGVKLREPLVIALLWCPGLAPAVFFGGILAMSRWSSGYVALLFWVASRCPSGLCVAEFGRRPGVWLHIKVYRKRLTLGK